MDVLVVASTVPAHDGDAVPRFVLDQALALARADPDVTVRILAPHTPASRALTWPRPESPDGRVTQDRFGYAPRRFETLTARGIMPAISAHRAMAAVVPALVAGERRALSRAVKAARPDVIYAHWFTPQAIVTASVARRAGVPFGFTTHAADVSVLRRMGPLGVRTVRRVTREAAFATAVSHQTAQRLLAFFDDAERPRIEHALAVEPMGVTLPAAPPPPAPDAARTVAVVARLVEKKGIHVLLEAWREVAAQVADARLIIAGDGPWRERLEAQAAGLAGVEFRGYVTGNAKAALEAEAGIAAVPSVVGRDGDVDGLPVAALEALARGAFVVASDASGAQEVLSDDPAGAVVAAGDATALAHALVAAMRRGDDEIEAARASAARLAQDYTWEALAPAMLTRLRAATGVRA